jgi:hypothetical protein
MKQPETAQDQLRHEILAAMWRYATESDVTIMETIQAAHQAAEHIFRITLEARAEDS